MSSLPRCKRHCRAIAWRTFNSRQSRERGQARLTEWGLGVTCPAGVLLPLRVLKKLQAALLGCRVHHEVATEQLAPIRPSRNQHGYRQVKLFARSHQKRNHTNGPSDISRATYRCCTVLLSSFPQAASEVHRATIGLPNGCTIVVGSEVR